MAVTLAGILAPAITPFGNDGGIDRAGFERNVAAHVAAGLSGVVLAGSTGEAALLEEEERRQLVRWARPLVPRDRLLIAGAGAESTRLAVRLARAAAEEGADAVLVVAPHYYGATAMTAEALIAHYTRIADESPVPVILYNIPKYAHFVLAPQMVHELAAHANIIGIKDSAGDLSLHTTYLNAQTDHFTVLTGSGQLLLQALQAGARGGILAVSTFAPALSLEVWERAGDGNAAAAELAQRALTPLAAEIVGAMGVPGVKAAHDYVGLAGGAPRPPLLPANEEQRRRVATLIEAAGVVAAA